MPESGQSKGTQQQAEVEVRQSSVTKEELGAG